MLEQTCAPVLSLEPLLPSAGGGSQGLTQGQVSGVGSGHGLEMGVGRGQKALLDAPRTQILTDVGCLSQSLAALGVKACLPPLQEGTGWQGRGPGPLTQPRRWGTKPSASTADG